MADKKYAPYPPAGNLIHVIRNVRDKGYAGKLSTEAVESMGIPDGNAYRVRAAIKWLKLYDDDDSPTALMVAIRTASTEKYPVLIEGMVRDAYGEVFQFVNPATDPIERVIDAFRSFDPAAQRNRMVVCFLALCKEAGIVTGDASIPEGPKPSKQPASKKKQTGKPTYTPPPPPLFTGIEEKLLAKFPEFDPTWSPEVQKSWFEGFSKLQDQLKK